MTMLLQFVVSFGFILVVNAPQSMVAYGSADRDRIGAGGAARRDILALAGLRVRRDGTGLDRLARLYGRTGTRRLCSAALFR